MPTPPKRSPRSHNCHTKELLQRYREKEPIGSIVREPPPLLGFVVLWMTAQGAARKRLMKRLCGPAGNMYTTHGENLMGADKKLEHRV